MPLRGADSDVSEMERHIMTVAPKCVVKFWVCCSIMYRKILVRCYIMYWKLQCIFFLCML